MRITQGYNGSYSHAPNVGGKPKDYPIDEGGANGGRDWFYCPCDEMIVSRITGIGNNFTNAIWLTSTSPVDMPCTKEYVSIMVVHPEDDDLSKLKINQIFKRGQAIFREGSDGNSSGNHFHMSCGIGKLIGNGWVKNTHGAWVINTTGGAVKPEEAFYINPKFTEIKSSQNIKFEFVKKEYSMVEIGEFSSSMEAAAWQFVLERRGFIGSLNKTNEKWKVIISNFPDGVEPKNLTESLSGIKCYSVVK